MILSCYLSFGCGSLTAFAFCFIYLLRFERHAFATALAARENGRRTGHAQGWQEAVTACEKKAAEATARAAAAAAALAAPKPEPAPSETAPPLPLSHLQLTIPRSLQGRRLVPWHAGKPSPHSVQWALMLDDTDDAEAENLSHEVASYIAALHDHFARPGIPAHSSKGRQLPARPGMRLPHPIQVTA